jgi:glycoprotein-N-acetylgalactosamine 3-beta-galactosyltransferase
MFHGRNTIIYIYVLDNKSVAKDLEKTVRVLCWIMTSPTNLNKKAIHVKKTWAKRCNIMVFISSENNASFPAIGLNVKEGRQHLTSKTMQAFKYVYVHSSHDLIKSGSSISIVSTISK